MSHSQPERPLPTLPINSLPSVKALRCFIAVANTLSFSQAALQLSLTQSAVSKQISALEQQLGQALFYRQGNKISLTKAAQRYLPKVHEVIELLSHSTANLQQTDPQRDLLNINVTPSFASMWLTEHLEQFSAQYQHIQINIKTGDGMITNQNAEYDLSVRCLPLSQHYEHAQLLCTENLLLIASPTLVKGSPITTVADLAQYCLLPQVTRPQLWEQFKQEQGICNDTKFHRIGYEHFYISLSAVKQDLGLALLPDFMVRDQIKRHELINPLQLSITSPFGYYLFIPRYKKKNNKVHAFSQWLVSKLKDESYQI